VALPVRAEGRTVENLPETHTFLKLLRAKIDEKYQGRVLLAEANPAADNVRHYFAKGRVPYGLPFPLDARIFMALAGRTGSR